MRRLLTTYSLLLIGAFAASCSVWMSRHTDDWTQDTSGVTHQTDTTLETGLPDSTYIDLVFPDAVLMMTMIDNTAEKPSGMVSFDTEEPIDSVLGFYDKLSTETIWSVTSSMESSDRGVRTVVYNFVNDDSSKALVTVRQEDDLTFITIVYGGE